MNNNRIRGQSLVPVSGRAKKKKNGQALSGTAPGKEAARAGPTKKTTSLWHVVTFPVSRISLMGAYRCELHINLPMTRSTAVRLAPFWRRCYGLFWAFQTPLLHAVVFLFLLVFAQVIFSVFGITNPLLHQHEMRRPM